MKPWHFLLRIDLFDETHLRRIDAALEGWATWERLPEGEETVLAERIGHADGVIGWAPAPLLAQGPVRLYLCGSAGVDAYRHHGLEEKAGFTLCNAAGTMSIPIAEHALAMMFALARRLPEHRLHQDERRFERIRDGGELSGSTLCVVGVGGSGTELARRCRALGMKVTGVRRRAGEPHPEIAEIHPVEALARAVSAADHVVCTLPASRETARLFDAGIFSAMKPGAFFYNVSRGAPVDGEALTAALASGHLAGAGLDVFDPEPVPPESPLWAMPNVILTGHSAGWSSRLADRLCALFLRNLEHLREGRPLENVVTL